MSSSDRDVLFANLQSINRLLELPVVMSAWQLALQRYEQLKHYSPLVDASLSKAEQTVQTVAEKSKPIVRKLERPRKLLDLESRGVTL